MTNTVWPAKTSRAHRGRGWPGGVAAGRRRMFKKRPIASNGYTMYESVHTLGGVRS